MARSRRTLWAVLLVVVSSVLAGCSEDQPAAPVSPATSVATPVPAAATPTREAPTAIPPTATPPAPLAALVNGQYVFLADYERRAGQYEQALLAQGVDGSSDEGKTTLAEARREVLDSLINTVLIEQASADLAVAVSDEEVEAQIAADIQAGGGQAAFEEWLAASGQSRDDYKQSLYEAMLWQRVMDAVSPQVPATAEQVHVRHIVLDTKEAADRVRAQLQAGTDFGQVARQSSLDVETRDNGGELGWFPRGLADPDLEAVIFALQPGEIAGPVEFGPGFRFVQVTGREASRPIAPEMELDMKRMAFERWLEQQRAEADIREFVNE
jgi:parvulin-like peptidyl-prolyl isomerase